VNCKTDADKASTQQDGDDTSLSRSNMDFSVSPSDNFYQFANGKWMATNPIPKEYPSWNTFMQLRVRNEEQLRDICDTLLQQTDHSTEDNAKEIDKLKWFYLAAMDEDAIEEASIQPMYSLLNLIDTAIDSLCDKAALAETLGRAGTPRS
jgi:putative endopeptidase